MAYEPASPEMKIAQPSKLHHGLGHALTRTHRRSVFANRPSPSAAPIGSLICAHLRHLWITFLAYATAFGRRQPALDNSQ